MHDGSDSTTALTDAAGAVTSRYRYNSAGLPASSNGSETGYTWIGAQYDSTTGLYYLGDRYYDPTTSRFISEDPASAQHFSPPLGRWTHRLPTPAVGLPVGFNRYAYAGDDPVNSADPSGDGFRAVLAAGACLITLANAGGIAEGTPYQEPLEQVAKCIEEYVKDTKEHREAIELAEEIAEADSEPVAAYIEDGIAEELVEVIEISIEITIAEGF